MPSIITPKSLQYTINNELLDELETMYSYVLDNMSMNVADPVASNIGFFNNSGRVYTDPQKVGRTRVYITRPNLNLRNPGNIVRSRVLSYGTGSDLGRTVARFLMYPDIIKNVSYGGLYKKTDPKQNVTYETCKILKGTADDCIVGNYGVFGDEKEILKYSYEIDKTPFIPVLSNLCTEVSNGKDIVLETEQTDANFSGNHLVYASGINESRGPGEITLSFEDIYGSPAFFTILIWVYYMHYVAKAVCNPELKYIINRIIDYTCSIYVFMLDTEQKTILRVTRYAGAFPKMVPFANIMHSKEIDIQSLSKFSVPFQYNFACPMDPVNFAEFNMVAETALTCRNGKGLKNSIYGIDREFLDASDFFFGRNHTITEKEALYFRNTWNPSKVPSKLLSPKDDILRANDMGPFGSSATIDANKLFGDTSNIDLSKNDEGKLKSFKNSQIGQYRGNLGDVYNYRSPYIVDGNKLMYL